LLLRVAEAALRRALANASSVQSGFASGGCSLPLNVGRSAPFDPLSLGSLLPASLGFVFGLFVS
jgi:hypothetical protein